MSFEPTRTAPVLSGKGAKIWAHVPEPPDEEPNAPPGMPPPDRPDEVDLPPREDPNKIDEPEIPPVPEPPMKARVRTARIAFTASCRVPRRISPRESSHASS